MDVPSHLDPAILRIPVKDEEIGIEGEIGLTNIPKAQELERKLFGDAVVALETESELASENRSRRSFLESTDSELRRGGFRIGQVPGLPQTYLDTIGARAKIRLTWRSNKNRRYLRPNLARNAIVTEPVLEQAICKAWLTYLIEHSAQLPEGQLDRIDIHGGILPRAGWLEAYSAHDVYCLARQQWTYYLKGTSWESKVEQ